MFKPEIKSIIHKYSDVEELPQVKLQVYSLEEMLAEKLRAISGQRRYAIARDLFNIKYLLTTPVNVEKVLKSFRRKCEIKGIKVKDINIEELKKRKQDYEVNWKNNLEYLIPENMTILFEDAWLASMNLLERAKSAR